MTWHAFLLAQHMAGVVVLTVCMGSILILIFRR